MGVEKMIGAESEEVADQHRRRNNESDLGVAGGQHPQALLAFSWFLVTHLSRFAFMAIRSIAFNFV